MDLTQLIRTIQDATGPVVVKLGDLIYDRANKKVTDLERYDLAPRRTRGTVVVLSPESFVAYWRDHATENSRIYVDTTPSSPSLFGVINHPHPTQRDWADHRVVLEFRKTPEWQTWVENDKASMSQVDFAEFLDDNVKDIVEPSSADMLEIVQTMSAKRTGNFRSATRLQDGSFAFLHSEDVEARAGKEGQLTIPSTFKLGIAPFEGMPKYAVTARLRYRLADGALTFNYALDRLSDTVRTAIDDARKVIEDGTGLKAFVGNPPVIPVN